MPKTHAKKEAKDVTWGVCILTVVMWCFNIDILIPTISIYLFPKLTCMDPESCQRCQFLEESSLPTSSNDLYLAGSMLVEDG